MAMRPGVGKAGLEPEGFAGLGKRAEVWYNKCCASEEQGGPQGWDHC